MHINEFQEKLVVYVNRCVNLDEISALVIKLKDANYAVNDFDNIVIYEDKVIGTILEISRGGENYFGVLDINVSKAKEENFLLKLEENINFDVDCDVYKYKNNYYLKLNEQSNIKIGRVLEYSKIIYGDIIYKIMKDENKVKGGMVI